MRVGRPTPGDVLSGFVTALFSIPQGMAYASIGGFNPVSGLYSGMVSTLVGSLFARTVFMITTLTSAIALSARSVLESAGLDPINMGNVAMLTVAVGLIMLVLGVLRVGAAIDFVSGAVMTGFTVGIAVKIVAGVLKDITGYTPTAHNTVVKFIDCVAHIHEWSLPAVLVAVGTIVAWAGFRLIKPVAALATLLALAVVTAVTAIGHVGVENVGDIAAIPNQLPPLSMPAWSALPDLLLGAFAIALVALAQASGISASAPNPDGTRPNASGDFTAQGLANTVGGFFGALPTGGSLSRSGVALATGAHTRWAGIFSGVWLVVLILVAGSAAEIIPMAVIGGLLVVIGFDLVSGRWADIVLVFRTAPLSAVAMVATFVATTQFPLQYAILAGAALSLILYCVQAARASRLVALDNVAGTWRTAEVPSTLPSDTVTVIHDFGVGIFAEVPRLDEQWPTLQPDSHHPVLILSVRTLPDVPSATLQKMLRKRADTFREHGGRLMIAGVRPKFLTILQRSGLAAELGDDNIFPATEEIFAALDAAHADAHAWIDRQHPSPTTDDS